MTTNQNRDMTLEMAKKSLDQFVEAYETLQFIGGFKNLVYEFKALGQAYILRLTMSHHRLESDVLGELDWVQYLKENGAPLSTPIHSLNGNVLEVITCDDQTFVACVFTKAEGHQLTYPDYLGNAGIFETLGRITGKIHKASKQYEPYANKRYENFDDFYRQQLDCQMPQEIAYMKIALDALQGELSQLEKDQASYGMIHGDINIGNFCVQDGHVTLFDFDECHYSWYVEDIAIQLYYTIYVMLDDGIEAREQMSDLFMTSFMKGYLQENFIEPRWMKQIPVFLRLRELIVHVGLYRSWDFDHLSPWRKNYFEQSRARITHAVPIVDYRNEWIGHTLFKTPRLQVRQFDLNDIDLIVEINNHPECIRFNGWESMSLAECQTVLDRWMSGYSDHTAHGAFCVVEVDTNMPIGMTFVKPLDDVNAFEIGFRLRRDAWGKGYAKELAAAYERYCATELRAEYIVAEVSAENHRSRNVFEKMGFDELPHPDGPSGVWYEKVLV